MEKKIEEVGKVSRQFKQAFERNDLTVAKSLLADLKLKLTEFSALPPLLQPTPTAKEELQLARDILEHAVVLSVKLKDEVAFERNFLQLKTYYTDTRHLLPSSDQEYAVLGLNLLRLLVQNRIAEFHTELELLPTGALENNCIQHAIELEQSLMEGSYNRVLSNRQRVPDPNYVYFMDLLMSTVRDEIAGCSEKAYDFLTVADAKKVLLLSSDGELQAYAKEHEWELRNGCVYFQSTSDSAHQKEIPSMQLISQTLGYARELERIV
eukprot:jgi/Mesen1/7345/ME000377S06568